MFETTQHLVAYISAKIGSDYIQELRPGRCFRLHARERPVLLKLYKGARSMEQARRESGFLERHGETVGYRRLGISELADVPNELVLPEGHFSWALYPWLASARPVAPLSLRTLAFLSRFANLVETLPVPEYPSVNDWGLHTWTIRARLARAKSSCRQAKDLSSFILDTAIPFVEDRLERAPRYLRWCHGDLKPENIVEYSEERHCVIDWESVHLDVPHYDRIYFFVEGIVSGNSAAPLSTHWNHYSRLMGIDFNLKSAAPLATAIVSGQLAALLAQGNSPRSDTYMQERCAVLSALLTAGVG